MYERILVPIDGSSASSNGLDEAIKLAGLTGARLRLIHVVDELSFATGFETCDVYCDTVVPMARGEGERVLQEGRARAEAKGICVETRLFETLAPHVSDLVVDDAKAWQADLIVIGTHGRRGVGRLLMAATQNRSFARPTYPSCWSGKSNMLPRTLGRQMRGAVFRCLCDSNSKASSKEQGKPPWQ